MFILPQVIINGFMLGSIYALVALGFTLIFSVMHIVNFAHGEMYTLAAFFVWALTATALGANYWLAVLISLVAVAGLAAILQRVAFRPLRGKGFQLLVCSLGILYLLHGGMLRFFGVADKIVPSVISGRISAWGTTLPSERVFILITAMCLIIPVYLLLYRTKIGRAMHAVSQDAEVASLYGVNPDRISYYCFIIGSVLAGVSGALLAPVFVTSVTTGHDFLFKSFVICVLGGLGSLPGAVAAGFVIGLVESIGLTFVGNSTHFFIFLILIITLIVRPRGLFGHA